MRAYVWSVVVCGLCGSGALGQDGTRFVERAPFQRNQPVHTQERAGDTTGVRPHAAPSVTFRDVGGYVGGARLLHNNVFARGAVTGPTTDGAYGTDYAGFHVRPGRVFLAASADPSVGVPFSRGYHTDGPFPKDVFAARPFRKALFEKREAAEERGHGHK
jgi:hypothetical protein